MLNSKLKLAVLLCLFTAVFAANGDDSQEKDGLYVGPLRVGGAFRLNYVYKDWDETYKDLGEFAFDTARINLDLEDENVIGSFEYRFYRDKFSDGHDYNMLHHGWLGWQEEYWNIKLGVHRVPFGILPYASHNWFFQLPYYVGLEDDYDLGAKYETWKDGWNFQAAYYVSDEGSWNGDSEDSARYSYDLVKENGAGNEEQNQGNLRLTHTWQHSEDCSTELGGSLQAGGVHNDNTDDHGTHYAAAVHLNGNYGRWNTMLEALYYKYDVDGDPVLDDKDYVLVGAYDYPYQIAAEAAIYSAGVSYTFPVNLGPVKSMTLYNDFSIMTKSKSDFSDTLQNVVGCSFAVNKFFVYVDVASGKNNPWLGGPWNNGLSNGGKKGWSTRFNVNIGYYF
ncbi:hypothetical protein SMSP2_02659 [Limihaloglobus sulfuriphilus]|uniref:Phosphate-selective porin n=1 Tax=Limihaloglobus sulfuriphilus TaxID=1851148 RepID=A0A1Q2MIW4_9BACT|nr:hypothetical protein [Limihaloglobus sulfuriphilus]AQQ72277.1 hypothetical protein SMSP2_02659 [Limihaloglobus sulfuriphilus]